MSDARRSARAATGGRARRASRLAADTAIECGPTSRPAPTVAAAPVRTSRCRSCCSRSARCWSPAPGSARSGTSCPSERFEPDSGPEPDLDPLRGALANVFERPRRVRRRRRPERAPREIVHGSGSPATWPTSPRTCPRPARTRGRPGRRGAVVVAVLVPVELGHPRGERAARRPVDAVPTCGWTPTKSSWRTRSSTPCTPDPPGGSLAMAPSWLPRSGCPATTSRVAMEVAIHVAARRTEARRRRLASTR